MRKIVWRNISWNKEHNQQWEEDPSECFNKVFGLTTNASEKNIVVNLSNEVPYLSLTATDIVTISGLPPYGYLRMRRTGSDNTDMQEKQANGEGDVVLVQDVATTYYFGEIGIGSYGYYWDINNVSTSLKDYLYEIASTDTLRISSTTSSATYESDKGFTKCSPVNFLMNNDAIVGVQNTNIKEGNSWRFMGEGKGWKYRSYAGQENRTPTANEMYAPSIWAENLKIHQINDFGLCSKHQAVVLAENFHSSYAEVACNSNRIKVNDTNPMELSNWTDDFDLYLVVRKSVTTLTKGLKKVTKWKTPTDAYWPDETGYGFHTTTFQQACVGVWIKDNDFTINTETTCSLLYKKLDFELDKISILIMLNSEEAQFITSGDEIDSIRYNTMQELPDTANFNHIWNLFTKEANFTYTYKDILDEFYKSLDSTPGWRTAMIRKNYYAFDSSYDATSPETYDKQVHWQLSFKNFITLQQGYDLSTNFSSISTKKINEVSLFHSGNYTINGFSPARYVESSLYSWFFIQTCYRLLPDYVNFIEESVKPISNIKCGSWSLQVYWYENIGTRYCSRNKYNLYGTAYEQTEGSMYAHMAQFSFGAWVNNPQLISKDNFGTDPNDISNTVYAGAIILVPKGTATVEEDRKSIIVPGLS